MKRDDSFKANDTINVLNSLGEGFLRVDTEGRIIMANLATAQMCGYESAEAMIGIHMKTWGESERLRSGICGIR